MSKSRGAGPEVPPGCGMAFGTMAVLMSMLPNTPLNGSDAAISICSQAQHCARCDVLM